MQLRMLQEGSRGIGAEDTLGALQPRLPSLVTGELLQLLDLFDNLLPGSLVQLPVLLQGGRLREGPTALAAGQWSQASRGLLAWCSAVLAHVL